MANKNYYLSPHSIAITPNSYNNLPDHLIVAIANGTKIRLAGKWENDMNGNKVNIGYTESLDYRTWNITGGQYHLPQSVSASAVFIYIKLLREGATGFVAFSSLDIDIIGQYNGAKGIEQLADASDYYYVRIAKLSAPNDSNLREILEFDTGEQDTDQGRDNTNSGDLDEMFQNNPSYITILKPFFRLFLFNSGKDSYIDRIITTVSDKLSDFSTWSNAHGLATTASTASYIATTLATFAEALNSKFLRKDQDDETEFGLTAATLTAKGSVTAASATVTGNISAGSAIVKGSVTAASASVGTLESKNGSSLQGTTKFSPNYTEGVAGGAITHPNTASTNDAKLQIEYLHVLKKATFESLEVNHVEHIAGNLIMSPAKATLFDVVIMDNGAIRCYFKAKDSDGNTINNTWRSGDQAYCCTFDTSSLGVTDANGNRIESKAGNHYWWRVVGQVSAITEEHISTATKEKAQCHWFDLDPTQFDAESDMPWVGDYVVLRGNLTDENRQGTIELNTSPDMKDDGTTPSVRIYNGINSFSMPESKIDMNPHHVKMLIDELKIVTGGENKTIKDYIEQETDQFHIFETETSDVPTLYNEPFVSWSEGERVKYSQSPNNAVILNKDGRTWRFFHNEVTNEYYFEEFTDPWLLAQHNKITNILDDKVITANEIPSMKEIAQKVLASWDDAEAEFGKFDDPSESLSDKLDALAEAIGFYYDDFLSYSERPDLYPAPLYFSDYNGEKEEGHYQYRFTRDKAIEYATAYERAITAWNYALASEKQSKIGETAAEEAKQEAIKYVSEHIDDIMRESTKEVVDGWIEEYTNGRFVEDSVYTSDKNSINLYTQWIDENFPEKVGGSGMWTKLNSMFAGTQSITFDTEGNIRNINKSGLVTDEQLAALTSRVENAEGKIVTEATISTWIENSFDNETNAQKLVSHATIYADKVSITSGKEGSIGDYWSIDEDGNAILKDIYARDITVSGVLLNLITTLEAGDERYIPSLTDSKGNIIANDLDVLRCGDVVRIKSTNGGNVNSIRLPYYINNTYSQRTLTMYGNKEHLITAEELRMLVGKRMTIIIEEGSGLSNYKSLKGVLNLESPYKTDFGQRIDELVNGTPVFALPEGLAENLEIAPSVPGTYNLQFKACIFKNGETYFTGYAWVYTSINLTATEIEWEDET